MARIYKRISLSILMAILLLGTQAVYAQNARMPNESSTRERSGPEIPSAKRRILLNIAKAVLDVLCAEYGDCTSTRNGPSETTTPGGGVSPTNLTPGTSGSTSRSSGQPRDFSFDTPLGWQAFEDQTSVTIAPASEYINGNLTNGVILGLLELNRASFESGTEKYVQGLISINKYLKRVGSPESNLVDNIPCITNRMEGQSPKTHYVEKVVVYACRRNAQKLFYTVTVNSGPNANRYEEENNRITQSLSFNQ